MSAVRSAVVALSLLGLAACTTSQMASDGLSEGGATPVVSAPQPIAGYDWFFGAEERDLWLLYGVAESDDIWLSLNCVSGTGKLDLSIPADEDHPKSISLESGGETETYPANSEPSELWDGVLLTATAQTRDPVFQRFRRTGWIATYGADHRSLMVPHADSVGGIEKFFDACG